MFKILFFKSNNSLKYKITSEIHKCLVIWYQNSYTFGFGLNFIFYESIDRTVEKGSSFIEENNV